MNIFPIIVVIILCALISLGTVFSGGIFQSISIESNNTSEQQTVQAHMTTSAWIYIIAALLIVAVIVMAFKLLRKAPS
jgi:preprotein translocase subunit SecG